MSVKMKMNCYITEKNNIICQYWKERKVTNVKISKSQKVVHKI